jgi:UDP-glucose 4-epimerase
MENVFVTGATGFVGQRLIGALVQKVDGNSSHVRLRLLTRIHNPDYESVVCDLQSDNLPDDALNGIDTVFHLAGYAHDLHAANNVENRYRAVNLDATVRLAELAVASGVKKFVFVSSVKASGPKVSGQCSNEKDQVAPEGIYGRTKREAEIQLLDIGRKSAMDVSIVRPSLVYGPDVKGNLCLMMSCIEKGWFPPLPKVKNRRSMIHVDDLVRVLLLVPQDERANGEIFIATDGNPYSSREIYDAMCHVLKKPVPKWSVPKFLFDMIGLMSPRLQYKVDKLLGDEYYSSEKLQSLGFKAQRSLREINETAF